MTVLLMDAFEKASSLPEEMQDELASGIIADIGKKVGSNNDRKLSWEETYLEMASKKEDWSDFDTTLMDGLTGDNFDPGEI